MSKSIYKYSVAIQCMTYNHSKYIEDALNGFIMQNTDFPYVILLVDDASTDGEGKIIAEYVDIHFDLCDTSVSYTKETEYAKITYAQHKTNLNCFIVAMYLKYNHYQIGKKHEKWEYVSEWLNSSKYIALCEGDDYWTDSNKLQKQVSLLEENPKLVMSYTAFTTVDENGAFMMRPFFTDNINRSKSGYILPELFKGNFIQTLTTLFRADYFFKMDNFFKYSGPRCDYYYFMGIAALGEVVFVSDCTGAYRYNPKGAIATKHDMINESLWHIYKFFALEFVRGRIGLEYTNKIKFKLYYQFFYRAVVRFIKGEDYSFIFQLMAAFFKNAG